MRTKAVYTIVIPSSGLAFRQFSYSADFPASAGTGFSTAPSTHCLTAGWGVVIP